MSGLDGLALLCAVGAALLFSVANNLQRGAASEVPLEIGGPVRLFLRLLRSPHWLLGSLLALAALGLHAIALARGGVIVVQAILTSGLVVALVIEARLARRWLHRTEVVGALTLAAGVLLLLGVGRPGGGRPVDLHAQLFGGGALVALAAIGFGLSRWAGGRQLSSLVLGLVAGSCFAVDALFLRGLALSLNDLDAPAALVDLAGFVAGSMLGNVIVQRGYQSAPLRVVLPAVTAADPLAAFVLGRWLLGERLQGGTLSSVAVGFGLFAIAAGIVLTTRGALGGVEAPAEQVEPAERGD